VQSEVDAVMSATKEAEQVLQDRMESQFDEMKACTLYTRPALT